jgi:hypothetical protein
MAPLTWNPWFFLGIGVVSATVNVFEISNLWAQFSFMEWFLLAISMMLPPSMPWRLNPARGSPEPTACLAFPIALGAYIPLWFAFRLAEGVAGGWAAAECVPEPHIVISNGPSGS